MFYWYIVNLYTRVRMHTCMQLFRASCTSMMHVEIVKFAITQSGKMVAVVVNIRQ